MVVMVVALLVLVLVLMMVVVEEVVVVVVVLIVQHGCYPTRAEEKESVLSRVQPFAIGCMLPPRPYRRSRWRTRPATVCATMPRGMGEKTHGIYRGCFDVWW